MSVNRIIGGHDRVGSALFYRNLKALQINLTDRTFRYNGIHLAAVLLLVIAGKVFEGGIRAAFHNSARAGCRKNPGNQRVLRKILKVASIKRTAADIQSRPEQSVHTVSDQLLAFHNIQLFNQLGIPGSCKQCTDWNLSCLVSAVHPDPGRAVCRTSYRNAVVEQLVADPAKSRSRTRCNQRAAHSLTPDNDRQILIAQLGDEGCHVYFSIMHIS
ncbi:hypothetical protein D3C73_831060 [compost metagenome]